MAGPKHPNNNNGLLRIRFKYNGVNYTLNNLGKVQDKIAYNRAQNICDAICRDLSVGMFNCADSLELALRYNPSGAHHILQKDQTVPNIQPQIKTSIKATCIDKLKKYDNGVEKSTLVKLEKYKKDLETKEDILEFVEWLKKDCKLQSTSISRYFDVLRQIDPIFKTVTIRKERKPKKKPFTKEEIVKILDWFKNNNKDYYYYVSFLFLTGARISEAIGLRWKHIDLDSKTIYFYETLARDNNNSTNRVVKTTKNNILREFPINEKLNNLLSELPQGDPEDLLFLFNGHCIDDKNFCNRYWKKCLKECNINYRSPYNTRHTFISHFLNQTKDVVKCAYLTHGSRTGIKTIYEHYAGIINKVEVPDLY